MTQGRHDICYVEVPLLVAGVGAFIVADTFLDVFGMAIDTLFLCFCVDSDKNDGVDKPYYMSKDLMVSDEFYHMSKMFYEWLIVAGMGWLTQPVR